MNGRISISYQRIQEGTIQKHSFLEPKRNAIIQNIGGTNNPVVFGKVEWFLLVWLVNLSFLFQDALTMKLSIFLGRIYSLV